MAQASFNSIGKHFQFRLQFLNVFRAKRRLADTARVRLRDPQVATHIQQYTVGKRTAPTRHQHIPISSSTVPAPHRYSTTSETISAQVSIAHRQGHTATAQLPKPIRQQRPFHIQIFSCSFQQSLFNKNLSTPSDFLLVIYMVS